MGLLHHVRAHPVSTIYLDVDSVAKNLVQGAFTVQLCNPEFIMAHGILVYYYTIGIMCSPCILFCSGGASTNPALFAI